MATYQKETALFKEGAISEIKDQIDETQDYFWVGEDGKIHVTKIPREEFLENPEEENILIDDNGLRIRKGEDIKAQYGETIIIGKPYVPGATDNESRMEIDYHSLKMTDFFDDEYFHISNLVDKDGNICEEFNAPKEGGTNLKFQVQFGIFDVSSVKVDGVELTQDVDYTRSGRTFTFLISISSNALISIKYITSPLNMAAAKAYTIGLRTGAVGISSFAEGFSITASGPYSHAEGYLTNASGNKSHAEGYETTASGVGSHAEGREAKANKDYSHAEGYYTTANKDYSHAEGFNTTANGIGSHAEGYGCHTYSDYCHAEGYNTRAGQEDLTTGTYAHAEGEETYAGGNRSHAEGYNTYAGGNSAHAEGYNTLAIGTYSHASGEGTYAYCHETAVGAYNIRSFNSDYAEEETDTLFSVGNGYSYQENGETITERSNAFTVYRSGNIEAGGGVKATGNYVSNGDKVFYEPGDTFGTGSYNYYCSGYTSSGAKGIYFEVPIGTKLIPSDMLWKTATVNTLTLILRQDNKYTHGSSDSTRVTPSSVVCRVTTRGLRFECTMASTTNAINNAPIGINAVIGVTLP